MLAHILEGQVHALYDTREPWMADYDIRDVAGVAGIKPGWLALADGRLVDPMLTERSTDDLLAYAAARRFAAETGGGFLDGVPIATDRDSQSMIANTVAYLAASGETSVRFKGRSGFVTLTADQLTSIAKAVGAHVQACFATESALDAAITAASPTVTSFAQIDAAFAALP